MSSRQDAEDWAFCLDEIAEELDQEGSPNAANRVKAAAATLRSQAEEIEAMRAELTTVARELSALVKPRPAGLATRLGRRAGK